MKKIEDLIVLGVIASLAIPAIVITLFILGAIAAERAF